MRDGGPAAGLSCCVQSAVQPADGSYEWQKLPGGEKQPWFISARAGEPFAFVGLREWWRPKDAAGHAQGLETFSILTTEPNAIIVPLHNRTPVMLAQKEWPRWFGARNQILERPQFSAQRLEAWWVGKDVGSVNNDRADPVGRAGGHAAQ